jgi:hypothetical protein
MKGYKLVEVEEKPIQVWKLLKESANYMAETIGRLITEKARAAEIESGQVVEKVKIRKGNFKLIAERRKGFLTPTREAQWFPFKVENENSTFTLILPEDQENQEVWLRHWPLTIGTAKLIVEFLYGISEDDIENAIDDHLSK